MLFTAPDGQMTLSLHAPNFEDESHITTGVLLPVEDTGDTLMAKTDNNVFVRLFYFFCYLFNG